MRPKVLATAVIGPSILRLPPMLCCNASRDGLIAYIIDCSHKADSVQSTVLKCVGLVHEATYVWDSGIHTMCLKDECVIYVGREQTVLEFWLGIAHKSGSPEMRCESINLVLCRYPRCGDSLETDHHDHRMLNIFLLFVLFLHLRCLILCSFAYSIHRRIQTKDSALSQFTGLFLLGHVRLGWYRPIIDGALQLDQDCLNPP